MLKIMKENQQKERFEKLNFDLESCISQRYI